MTFSYQDKPKSLKLLQCGWADSWAHLGVAAFLRQGNAMTMLNPSREWTAHQKREYAARLIDDIIRLSDETHPKDGEASERGKDRRARTALARINELSDIFGGWATHHLVGAGLKKQRKKRDEIVGEIEFSEAREEIDSHQNELLGRRRLLIDDLDPSIAREIIIDQLSNVGRLDGQLLNVLINALQALKFGEVLPVIQPASINLKARWSDLRHKLRAVELVEFFDKSGMKKIAAQEKVAVAYGQRTATVVGWTKQVYAALGEIEVGAAIEWARHAATVNSERVLARAQLDRDIAAASLEDREDTRAQGEITLKLRYYEDPRFGDDALQRAGQEYQTFSRKKKRADLVA